MSGGARVSIPSSVRKTIQNIKEITGNHSEEEVYAMLKECSMDPNETTQKLLLQDTFHEVKRKRDRRKENMNKEAVESRWKPGMQGRGNRAGRGNYPARYMSQDAGDGKNSASGMENGMTQVLDKGIGPTNLSTSQEMKSKETVSTPSSLTITANGPSGSSSVIQASDSSVRRMVNHSEVIADDVNNTLEGTPSLAPVVDANKSLPSAFVTGETHGHVMLKSTSFLPSGISLSSSEVYLSASDPVLLPSQDTRLPGSVGTIRREVGTRRSQADQIAVTPAENKPSTDVLLLITEAAACEAGTSFVQGNMPNESQVGKNQLPESSDPSGGRPSSNYSSRSQVIGPYKVGPSMEWKPKPANPSPIQGPGTAVSSEVLPFSVETDDQSQPAVTVTDSKETSTLELVKKLEDTHISDGQHVIIPNHLHVPDAEKLGFCFGSFGASFSINTSYSSGHASAKSPPPLSEISDETEEIGEEHTSSDQNAMVDIDQGDYGDQPQSSSHVPENVPSGKGNVSSTMVSEYGEPKQEMALPLGSNQPSMVHTSTNYSFGFMPPILGSQVTALESSESQARDFSHLPSFIVQQPLDPANYYAQFYCSGADSDGRISPFHLPGIATKYNGNVSVLPPHTSQSPQEGGNSLVLSSGVPTPLATQAAGIIPSSIPVTQQQLPVFRQPTGMHLPHYPPNYIPYGHFFSPFYVPNPAIHQFLSNSAFPQQPLAGSVYPAQPAATAKYSLSQYKPGTNTGNSTHIGGAGNYGSFGSSPDGYNPSSAAMAGNSTSNEDLAASQFKDNNAYITGQQSEGSGVWIAASGRDMSCLPASSFYNLPQGQLAFTPAQAGHGAFAGIYHPAQPVTASTVHPLLQQSQTMAGAIDMVGPTSSLYQQPQHAQMNWPNNY